MDGQRISENFDYITLRPYLKWNTHCSRMAIRHFLDATAPAAAKISITANTSTILFYTVPEEK